jgi:signal transduction histidine kinase/ActR/RegA family two-component response regulator
MSTTAPSRPVAADRPARATWWPGRAVRGVTVHGLIIAASLVLPLSVLAGGSLLAWRGQVAQARIDLVRSVDLAHENTERVFETYQLLLRAAAAVVAEGSDADILAHERQIHDRLAVMLGKLPQARALFVLDGAGQTLASAVRFPAAHAVSLADRDYFKALASGGTELSVGAVQASRLDEKPFFAVALARRDAAGGFLGAVVVTVSPSYFEDYWVHNELADATADGTTMVIFRADGRFLVRWPQPIEPGRGMYASDVFREQIAARPDSGVYETTYADDGIHRLLAYRRVEGAPLYVVGAMRYAGITRAWLGLMQTHLYFGVPATLGLFLLALLAARRSARLAAALDELRQEELRRQEMEEALRQTQKTEALGRLTGGIAHDFNNLLTVIGGSIERLGRAVPEADTRARRAASLGAEAVKRAARLTHRLLAFARQQPLSMQAANLNRLVSGMSELLLRTLGEDIEIETVLASGLWPTLTDPAQLENCLLNLAVNARDAMPHGGKLTIETANAHLDTTYAGAYPDVRAGQYVMLAVTDTGAGMTAETIARAFDPFFTTKPTGVGTGLGLSMVYGFTKQSGGHAKIYSELGHGTTVKLYLPRAPLGSEVALPERQAQPVTATGDGQTILVVEDDEAVQAVTAGFLDDLGYRAVCARDAATALAVVRERADIVLLFTDVVLPGGTNGRQLAEQVLRIRPGLKVLFTSGYTPNAIIHGGILDPDVELLSKPFTADALAEKLKAILGADG